MDGWVKIEILNDFMAVHIENWLVAEFSMIFWRRGGLSLSALLLEKQKHKENEIEIEINIELDSHTYFLSPKAVGQSSSIMKEIKFAPCVQPDPDNVELVVGRSTFWERYEDQIKKM